MYSYKSRREGNIVNEIENTLKQLKEYAVHEKEMVYVKR